MSTKIRPNNTHALRKIPLIVEQRFRNAEDLERAKYTQTFMPWLALEALATGRATEQDWALIQYHLYYAEALVSLYRSKIPDDNTEIGFTIGQAIASLYAVGRRYKTIVPKKLAATPDELDYISVGLQNGDAYKEITEEWMLLVVAKHVSKVLGAS